MFAAGYAFLPQLEMATAYRDFKVPAVKRAISFFRRLSIYSTISSLKPWGKKKKTCTSVAYHLPPKNRNMDLVSGQKWDTWWWSYQKCLWTFLFDLQLKFDLARVKAIIAAIKSSWHPPPVKLLHHEYVCQGGRRNAQTQDAKSSTQIHMCLTDTEWNTS